MTSKERIRTVMEGGVPDRAPVSLYVSWPEYGWRFSGHPVWKVVLGRIDGIEATDRLLSRHPADFAPGPVGDYGSGVLDGKTLESETDRYALFRDDASGRRYRFDLKSHVFVEIDDSGRLVDHAGHAGDARFEIVPPRSIGDAEEWFRRGPGSRPAVPAHAPNADKAIAQWGAEYFMVTCTLGPFIAVGYAFGFERSLELLAEEPRTYARLMELYIEHFRPHYQWAAEAGYDGGHMVESWCSADIISPATYRDWIAPAHRESASMIRECGLKADLYSPGYFLPMLRDLRGQGWDALRIDDQCHGEELDIGEARKILGDDQCLFGNMSAYSLLRGDRAEIEARTRHQIESAARDAPFIISNGSGICDGTDPSAIDHWLRYAREEFGCVHEPNTSFTASR